LYAALIFLLLVPGVTGCHKRPEKMDNIYGYPNTPALTDADKFPPINTNDIASDKPIAVALPDPTLRETWIRDRKVFEKDTVYFDFDSSVVKPGEKPKVANVAGYLKSKPGHAVEIEGHCDERGTEEYNRSLGERRALAVREALIRAGIDGSLIDTKSFGKDRPAVQGRDEAAFKKNRRGEFLLETPPPKP
jgi:peptidoglycan-associated lipoprotein